MPSRNKTEKFELSQFTGDDTPIWHLDYTEDMKKIEENALHKGDFVKSPTPPENPSDGMVWRKPIGALSLTGEIGFGGVQPLQISGASYGVEPPEDKSKLWVKPITTI